TWNSNGPRSGITRRMSFGVPKPRRLSPNLSPAEVDRFRDREPRGFNKEDNSTAAEISQVRARTEATGCDRSSGESAIETAGRSLLPGLYHRSVLRPAGARSARMWCAPVMRWWARLKISRDAGNSRRHHAVVPR